MQLEQIAQWRAIPVTADVMHGRLGASDPS